MTAELHHSNEVPADEHDRQVSCGDTDTDRAFSAANVARHPDGEERDVVAGQRNVSAAEEAFAHLTADQRTRLLRGVFDILEYDLDGRTGSEWSSDTTQALGELFDTHGIAFTDPD